MTQSNSDGVSVGLTNDNKIIVGVSDKDTCMTVSLLLTQAQFVYESLGRAIEEARTIMDEPPPSLHLLPAYRGGPVAMTPAPGGGHQPTQRGGFQPINPEPPPKKP